MKVVLDTNVLMSGIFFGGVPSKILERAVKGDFDWLITNEIWAEYSDVANRLQKKTQGLNIEEILKFIQISATWIDAPTLDSQITADPDDEKFIACAVAGGARLIVSGDKHLLDVGQFNRIQILKPRDFWEILEHV